MKSSELFFIYVTLIKLNLSDIVITNKYILNNTTFVKFSKSYLFIKIALLKIYNLIVSLQHLKHFKMSVVKNHLNFLRTFAA